MKNKTHGTPQIILPDKAGNQRRQQMTEKTHDRYAVQQSK